MSKSLAEGSNLLETLKKEFANPPKADLKRCGELLSKLKIALAQLSYLAGEEAEDVKALLIAREALEIGALWSIHMQDIPSFERYLTQVKVYYVDYKSKLPESPRMYSLLGLGLLCLLAQNRIADFHTEVEMIDVDKLDSVYIKHPLAIEQGLMEGSYNKVWNARNNVPSQESLFFVNILVGTIRNEIASCSEKAYASIPITDAATLLFFPKVEEVISFATARGWTIVGKSISFRSQQSKDAERIPVTGTIAQVFEYARELERIV